MPPVQTAHNPNPGGFLGGSGLDTLLGIALGLAGTASSNSFILTANSERGSAIRYHSNYSQELLSWFLV